MKSNQPLNRHYLNFFLLFSLVLVLHITSCGRSKSDQSSQSKSENTINKSENTSKQDEVPNQEGSLDMHVVPIELVGDAKTTEVSFTVVGDNKIADLAKFKLRITFTEIGGKGSTIAYTDGENLSKSIVTTLEESLLPFFSITKLEPNKGPLKILFTLVPTLDVSSMEIKFELLDIQNKTVKEETVRWASNPVDIELKTIPLSPSKLSGAARTIRFKIEKETGSEDIDLNKLQLVIKEKGSGNVAKVSYKGKVVTVLSGLEMGALGSEITLLIEPGTATKAVFVLEVVYDGNRMKKTEIFTWTEPIDYNKELLLAVLAGDAAKVNQLLQIADIDVNTGESRSGRTPLHIAIEAGNQPIMEVLLQNPKIDINIQDQSGSTPLHMAALVGNEAAMKVLLSKGAKVTLQNKTGSTPLHVAVQKQNPAIVAELLKVKDIDVNAKDNQDNTPLHIAAEAKNKMAVVALLDKGAKINLQNKTRSTPLHIAVGQDDQAIVEVLLGAKDIEVNPRDNQGNTPLHRAAKIKNVDIVMRLLNQGADVNATNNYDKTLFDRAVEGGNKGVITILLEEKVVDLNVPDKSDDTPLGKAIKQKDERMVAILLEIKGIDVNAKDSWHNTPLHKAIKVKSIAIIKLLLSKGAKIDAADANNNSPLHLAVEVGDQAIINQLLGTKDIDVNARNKQGNTPLYIAVEEKNIAAVAALLNKGANANAEYNHGRGTLLHLAVESANQTIINQFLDVKDINVNAQDAWYRTPLHIAVETQNEAAIRALLNKKADINAKQVIGYTSLHKAISIGNVAIIRILLGVEGIDINSHSEEALVSIDGNTPLHLAIINNNPTVIQLLLSQGARQDIKNKQGKTAVDLARESTNDEIKKLFGII